MHFRPGERPALPRLERRAAQLQLACEADRRLEVEDRVPCTKRRLPLAGSGGSKGPSFSERLTPACRHVHGLSTFLDALHDPSLRVEQLRKAGGKPLGR